MDKQNINARFIHNMGKTKTSSVRIQQPPGGFSSIFPDNNFSNPYPSRQQINYKANYNAFTKPNNNNNNNNNLIHNNNINSSANYSNANIKYNLEGFGNDIKQFFNNGNGSNKKLNMNKDMSANDVIQKSKSSTKIMAVVNPNNGQKIYANNYNNNYNTQLANVNLNTKNIIVHPVSNYKVNNKSNCNSNSKVTKSKSKTKVGPVWRNKSPQIRI